MAAITFKCPNCGGDLVFDPSGQNYKCSYCGSVFTQEELDSLHGASASAESQTAGEENGAVVYSCPSCGAEIVTDATTAATFCYFCHNPVVLEGRLSGDYLPDQIIPFKLDENEAKQKLKEFIRKKRYVPKAFADESQIEKLSGVYYPYWVYDCEVSGSMNLEGTKLRVWRDSRKEYTQTSIFSVERSGTASLRNITRNALEKTNRELVENVQPYSLGSMQPFTIGYLSGFMAEKRDMEKDRFSDELQKEARNYAGGLMRETVSGYNTTRLISSDYQITGETWHYVLLPVWVLTYRSLGQLYYFAMNGQTGAVAGKLPVDMKKLSLHCALLGAIVAVLILIGGYLL